MPEFELQIESRKRMDPPAGDVKAVRTAIEGDARVSAVSVVGSNSGALACTCRVTAEDGNAATAVGKDVFKDALRAGGFPDSEAWPIKIGGRGVG